MDRSRTAAPPVEHRWTRAQYEQMIDAGVFAEDDRVELIEGTIVAMSPQGSRHATAVGLVEDELRQAYPRPDLFLRIQMPVALGSTSEPEPDVAVVEGARRDFVDQHPTTALLVVEVSETSAAFDRTAKQTLYARHGIGTYWLLDLEADHLEVYRHPAGERYEEKTTLHRGDTVVPPDGSQSVAVNDVLP